MKIEDIRIISLSYGGDGIGRISDGRVCFVPGVIPGELVRVRIRQEKKNFVRGGLESILESSSSRIVPACSLYGECPGCVYMHCSYDLELRCKEQQLCDFILRNHIADSEAVLPGYPSPVELNYRNKLTLHRRGDGKYGYFGKDNKSIVPVERCLLASQKINDIISQSGGSKAVFRETLFDGALQIIDGQGQILREFLDGAGEFLVSGDGFFQTNPFVASALLREVVKAVKNSGCDELLELYCGVGIFSITISKEIAGIKCIGVELDSKAIDFAVKNAKHHNSDKRCRFFTADAGVFLKRFRKDRNSKLAVIVDPPRSGMEQTAIKGLTELMPHRIIYISCAADTLVRDLRKITASGYKVTSVRLLDMFPRTAHFEVLTILEQM